MGFRCVQAGLGLHYRPICGISVAHCVSSKFSLSRAWRLSPWQLCRLFVRTSPVRSPGACCRLPRGAAGVSVYTDCGPSGIVCSLKKYDTNVYCYTRHPLRRRILWAIRELCAFCETNLALLFTVNSFSHVFFFFGLLLL